MSQDYGVHDHMLNRYLNAVASTDSLIARLVGAIDDLNLPNHTLVIVTGDHGEAFGEHGRLSHDFTIYDEEVHIPLIFIDPKNARSGTRVTRIGRQIDIAPTILQMLGYQPPTEWQGSSLFGSNISRRAYLFSSWASFTLGLVDGDFEYICDFDKDRVELYDLLTDPGEKRDLSRDPIYSARMKEDQLRLQAWLSFQNRYLERFRSGQH
jgi:arylsulfatase A-like enzyme